MILQTIFLLARKTVRTLITPEIAILIIQCVIFTGTIIGVLLGCVRLLLSFTNVFEWAPNFIDSAIVKCEVIRSLFDGANYYDIGLQFIPPNTGYLKQLVELLKTD